MNFSEKFICATEEFSSFEKFVPAPYFRKEFVLEKSINCLEITICGLGFYRLWINGTEITKGIIAPYVSNPDDVKYYDNYDISSYVLTGKNVIGVMLGNGMLNNPGGEIWDFEKATFRRSATLAFCVEGTYSDGEAIEFEADSSVLCAESPLYFDDYRCGERYDASKEIIGWNLPDFDASLWKNSMKTIAPYGECRICTSEPVKPTGEILAPVSIKKGRIADDYKIHKKMAYIEPCEKSCLKEGFIYDFGKNTAGVPMLKIKGNKGQRIELQFGEYLTDNGEFTYRNINFFPNEYSQRDVFICSGEEDEFMPYFTYHGARYCIVMGITEEQATEELLAFIVCNSQLKDTASFNCSDETANKLYNMCRTSDLANFFYFPTDCPHREKNGWTGDIALSSEHMLMMYNCESSLSEWLVNVRKSQLESGEYYGIIPTFDWGLGFGPSWDAFVTCICYYAYIYKADIKILEDNAESILKYLHWADNTRNEKGLVKEGLGDWCPVGGNGNVKASKAFTSNVTFIDTCNKAVFIFEVLGNNEAKSYAEKLSAEVKTSVRNEFIDTEKLIADTNCQTSQAMAIYYGIFTEEEKKGAFEELVKIINNNDDFLDFGILGARCMFHLLSDFGESSLAYKMITRPEWPSYGHFIEQGLTSLPESFFRDFSECDSLNHHFFGDIANWFISKLAGIRYNPDGKSHSSVIIKPDFIDSVDYAEASLDTPCGRISVLWKKTGGKVLLNVDADSRLNVTVMNKDIIIGAGSGEYTI